VNFLEPGPSGVNVQRGTLEAVTERARCKAMSHLTNQPQKIVRLTSVADRRQEKRMSSFKLFGAALILSVDGVRHAGIRAVSRAT
jgi:hypothetical protein